MNASQNGMTKMNTDLLNMILEKQREHAAYAFSELINGEKETHWSWYFYPNVRGLGISAIAINFSLSPMTFVEFYKNSPEYRGYINTAFFLTDHAYRNAPRMQLEEILGEVDALKFRSFGTLFQLSFIHDDGIIDYIPMAMRGKVKNFTGCYGVCEHTRNICLKAFFSKV